MATLAEKIYQEQTKLEELLKKRETLDRKIKKAQGNLERLQLIKNNARYSAIEQAAQGTGLSVEDILAALKSGDLLGLQERMDAAKEAAGAEATEIL